MKLLLLGAVLFLVTPNSWAGFIFTPVVAELAPAGPKSSMAFTFRNQTEAKTPVMVTIVHRNPGPDGKEEYVETPDIDDMFQIYPSQLILGPNDLRTVRISWIGDPKIKSEMAFRVIAEELPFSMDSEAKSDKKVQGQITIATKYIGSLYVTPPEGTPNVTMTAKFADPEYKEHKGKIQFEVTNTGTKHLKLSGDVKLKIETPKGEVLTEASPQALTHVKTENFLAGKMRRFFLNGPAKPTEGPFKVTFELPKTQ